MPDQHTVTASLDRLDFHYPVFVGGLLFPKARINTAGRTSMEIGVRVEAENFVTGEVRHTSSAYLTFVALDESGRPNPVPPLVIESDDERWRNQEALMRKKMGFDQRTKENKCQKSGICEL